MKSSKKKLLSVLLLDDEPQIIKLNEELLHEEFLVYKAKNIREANTVIEKYPIHIIVSDHYLSEENGLNFLNEVHKYRPNIIKIILSSCTCHEVILQSHNSESVFRYLTKPCLNEDLLENIRLAQIAWEVKECEEQIKNEHSSLKKELSEVDFIEIKKSLHLKSIELITFKTLKSLLYLGFALFLSASLSLVILYCLKSLLGFNIFN